MIFQYAFRIPEVVSEEVKNKFLEIVSAERLVRINKYRFEADKQRSLFAEMLLRYGLTRDFGLDNKEISFVIDEYGKPSLKEKDNIHFNLSHSGDWVVCAIGDVPMGVDVEQVKEKNLDIAKRFYMDYEYKKILAQKECDRSKCFIQFWTLKESYIKAEGKGLSIPLESFGFRLNNGDITLYVEEKQEKEYHFYEYSIDKNYEASICSKEKEIGEFKQISLEDMISCFSK